MADTARRFLMRARVVDRVPGTDAKLHVAGQSAMKDPEYYRNTRREMLPFVPAGAQRILDVGCGEGSFGALLADRGAEVWGIEPTDSATVAANVLRRVVRLPIEQAHTELPAGYFDCVIFNDVLEHLVDPWATLRQARTWLEDRGCVVASIPNVRHITVLRDLLLRGQWTYTHDGILDSTHLRFFTKSSIRAMFENCRYELMRLQGINGAASWKFRVVNAISLNRLSDSRYFQFACVARRAP